MCKQRNTTIGPWCTRLFAHIIILHGKKWNKIQLSQDIYVKLTAYDGTTTSGTQPPKNMTTMGKVDTSDLTMIMRWVINISSRSPELQWTSLTHTTPLIGKKIRKVIERELTTSFSPWYNSIMGKHSFLSTSRIRLSGQLVAMSLSPRSSFVFCITRAIWRCRKNFS